MINFLNILSLQERTVSTAAERYLLVYMIVVLLIVTTLVIVFLWSFRSEKQTID